MARTKRAQQRMVTEGELRANIRQFDPAEVATPSEPDSIAEESLALSHRRTGGAITSQVGPAARLSLRSSVTNGHSSASATATYHPS